MKLFLAFLCLSLVGVICCSAQHDESSEEDSSEEKDTRQPHFFGRHGGHGHHGHDHGHDHEHGHGHKHFGKCQGMEDVDLSDLAIDVDDLRKQFPKSSDSQENEIRSEGDGEEFSLEDIKTGMTENGMGVIRKLVILPSKKKIIAKIEKVSKSSGDFTSSLSGSMNSSVDAKTNGELKFEVDMTVIAPHGNMHGSLTGDAKVDAKSSTKFVKKGPLRIVETSSTADSDTKMSWSNDDLGKGEVEAKMTSSSKSGTALLSKKCFATGIWTKFNTSVDHSEVSSSIVGKGKGGAYTHLLFASKNGSVAVTFARVTMKTWLSIKGENYTLIGSQYIVVKSFTESISRPVKSEKKDELKMEISNEIKIRVEVKTKLSNGMKVYSTGGQVIFRNSKITVPQKEELEGQSLEGSEGEEETEAAATLMGSAHFRKQVQAEEILSNPAFVNSVIASAIN